jgi:cytochrome P450
MRITAPPPAARADLAGVDLVDPDFYARGDPHLVWQTLRAEHPVYRHPWRDRGFWVVTRHCDVREVLRDHATYTSERGILLSTLYEPDPAAGAMVALTDPPRHQRVRAPLSRPLARHSVAGHEPWLRTLVRETVAPAWECEVWDVAAAFARLPVAAIATLMGFPPSDVDFLLRWAYTAVAPRDPHYRLGTEAATLRRAHHELMNYLRHRVGERRARPADDLLGQLLRAEVGGRAMTEEEVIVNCFNLFLGAAVTTSQAVVAPMIALAEQGDGEGRWPADAPVATAVEEALRWSAPTMQFVRYARRDVPMHDVTIGAGDAVCASIASANRDERVFTRPHRFDPTRTPNPHVAFGGGVHYCVGQGLARLILGLVIEEFLARVESFELAGPPVHLASNLAAAVVSAPVRLRPRRTRPRRAVGAFVPSSSRR